MTPETRDALRRHAIRVHGAPETVELLAPAGGPIAMEANVELRRGRFQVGRIGAFSYLGGGHCHLRNVTSIGRFCAIASNVIAGQVEHPGDWISPHPVLQGGWGRGLPEVDAFLERNSGPVGRSRTAYLERFSDKRCPIVIGNDVWIGEGAFIRRGVTLGHGCVVAARAVVVRDVPPFSIVAGSPARVVRVRFDPETVARMLELEWWRYGLGILDGVEFDRVDEALDLMEVRVARGDVVPYEPEVLILRPDGLVTAGAGHAGQGDRSPAI